MIRIQITDGSDEFALGVDFIQVRNRDASTRELARIVRQAMRFAPVLVNEALTHTDLPQLDQIELYNSNSTSASIANWYLTDDRKEPKKFRIPASDSRATIPGSGKPGSTRARRCSG